MITYNCFHENSNFFFVWRFPPTLRYGLKVRKSQKQSSFFGRNENSFWDFMTFRHDLSVATIDEMWIFFFFLMFVRLWRFSQVLTVYVSVFKSFWRQETRTMVAQWILFSSKSQNLGLGQSIWADAFWGIWGIFNRPIFVLSLVHVYY